MKRLIYALMISCLACFFFSCAVVPLDVNKILELNPDDKIYTAYNLWFDVNNEISQVHYHNGKILPFGTEVKIIEAYQDRVLFKAVATGETYKVSILKKFAVYKTEVYIKWALTKKTPDKIVEGVSPEVLEKIKKGVVAKGMTKSEVLICYGYPSAHRTPSLKEDAWIFFNSPVETERVLFNRKGLVIDIIKQEEVKK